jgi:hypothetical protein
MRAAAHDQFRTFYATGPDKNGYYHDLFLRSRLDLAQRVGRVEKKPSLCAGPRLVDHPDFSKLSPMPRESTTTMSAPSALMSVPATVISSPSPSQATASLSHGSLSHLSSARSMRTIEMPLHGLVDHHPTLWHNPNPTIDYGAALMSVPQPVISLPTPWQAMGLLSHGSLHHHLSPASSMRTIEMPRHGFVDQHPTLWHNPTHGALVPQQPLSLNSSVSPLYREQQYCRMDSPPSAPQWASACHRRCDHVDPLAAVASSSATPARLISTSTPMRQDRTLATSLATYEQLLLAAMQSTQRE